MEHDLQEQVAELLGEGGRAGVERVIDLVRLLQQVLAERGAGLLAVPRTSVGAAQAIRDPGHRPRPAEGELGRDRLHVQRSREGLGRQPPIGPSTCRNGSPGGRCRAGRSTASGSWPAGLCLPGSGLTGRCRPPCGASAARGEVGGMPQRRRDDPPGRTTWRPAAGASSPSATRPATRASSTALDAPLAPIDRDRVLLVGVPVAERVLGAGRHQAGAPRGSAPAPRTPCRGTARRRQC